ncbi:hypothetical protein HispidOSU_004166, partial [Sigmodon hispidus]
MALDIQQIPLQNPPLTRPTFLKVCFSTSCLEETRKKKKHLTILGAFDNPYLVLTEHK